VKSSRARPVKDAAATESPPLRRFVPQLEEANIKSSRRGVDMKPDKPTAEAKLHKTLPSQLEQAAPTKTRRFAPQLIETTKRSRKRGDTLPALQHTDKTDLSPGDNIYLPRHLRQPRQSSLSDVQEHLSDTGADNRIHVADSQFSSSALSRRAPRRTSFQVSQLPTIKSPTESEAESGESNCPSLSTSPSAHSDQVEQVRKHVKHVQPSYDDRFSEYLLELAARAAENQLRNQAMAAYPNEKVHEPVDHFAVDRDSVDTSDSEEMGIGMLRRDPVVERQMFRRESVAGWEMEEMRQHMEALEKQRKQHAFRESSSDAPCLPHERQTPHTGFGAFPATAGQKQEVTNMRNAASPPMLGRDLTFVMCISPKPTTFDSTQRPCSRISGAVHSRQHSGLWTPGGGASRQCSGHGLWHGVCIASENEELSKHKMLQTGLMTPFPEPSEPSTEPSTFLSPGNTHQLPASPPTSESYMEIPGVDDILTLEARIEAEYPDSFVTQVYNYLSLGYPSLARKYDEELSKITKIPVEEIRRNDGEVDKKGHIGTPEGTCDEEAEKGGRWEALRLYVREWARQQPGMISREEGWGTRIRRGSWAV
jgi:hypothetical protein